MNEEELDVVEFTDEDGNKLLLEVVDNFFYNGEEFAVLTEWDACECEDACDCGCGCGSHEHAHDEDDEDDEDDDEDGCEQEQNLYIMKVETFVGDDGEEMEEFIPVEDSLMETLIEIVQTRYFDENDEDDDDGNDEEDEEPEE